MHTTMANTKTRQHALCLHIQWSTMREVLDISTTATPRHFFKLFGYFKTSPFHLSHAEQEEGRITAVSNHGRCHGVLWGGHVHPTFFLRVFLGLGRCEAY